MLITIKPKRKHKERTNHKDAKQQYKRPHRDVIRSVEYVSEIEEEYDKEAER